MKVYLSNYRYHWISPYRIMEKIIFWREIDYDEPFIKKCNKLLHPFCAAWQKFLDIVHPQVQFVKIDYWDTYSLDHSLAYIILPLLKQMKDCKSGYGWVQDDDVPEELKSYNGTRQDEYSWDSNAEARYDYIINEMIWAFEQKVKDDDEMEFYDHTECEDIENLGVEDFMKSLKKIKVNKEGLKAHHDRKSNGFRLFGKYYESLWT